MFGTADRKLHTEFTDEWHIRTYSVTYAYTAVLLIQPGLDWDSERAVGNVHLYTAQFSPGNTRYSTCYPRRRLDFRPINMMYRYSVYSNIMYKGVPFKVIDRCRN